MDLATIIADAQLVLGIGKTLYSIGEDAAPFFENAYNILSGHPLTDEQRAEMQAQETALRNRLNAPLEDDPPSTGGA